MSSIQFREIVRRQFEVYFAAARQLLELICIGLDIDQSKFDNLLENHASTFRLIHNPPRHDIIPDGKIPARWRFGSSVRATRSSGVGHVRR